MCLIMKSGIIRLSALLIALPLFYYSCTIIDNNVVETGYGLKVQNGMVVSAYPDASIIGVKILQNGGNAVDATAAIHFALAVCNPAAGNLGGGGLLVVRESDGNIAALDYREKAPLVAARDMYLDDKGEVIPGLSTSTHLASGVPGTVAGIAEVHNKYGNLSFKEVIQPGIDLARQGFVVSDKLARSLNKMKDRFIERNSHITAFVKDESWVEGDTIRQPELAETLELIRDYGMDGFYRGRTADLIIKEMERVNGIITHGDLENYKAVWRDPITGSYKGYRIISMPPPSSGGVAIIQLLGMIENYPVSEWGFHSDKSIHLMTEAERRVYADRAEYLGDPDFVKIPVEELMGIDYLAGRMSDFNPDQSGDSRDISAGSIPGYESEETTHFSVVDGDGMAVSVTTTLNGAYGNGIVVEGAGFLLNNEMDDFSVKPGYPNIYGLIGGEANSIQPDKRMLSSMTPTIIEENGELFMIVGSPGGSTIITSVFQTILNVIEFNMDMQTAVSAGRFHHQWLPDQISVESDVFDTLLVQKLEKMGHTIAKRPSIGRVDAIRVLSDGSYEGGADPRGDDTAAGY